MPGLNKINKTFTVATLPCEQRNAQNKKVKSIAGYHVGYHKYKSRAFSQKDIFSQNLHTIAIEDFVKMLQIALRQIELISYENHRVLHLLFKSWLIMDTSPKPKQTNLQIETILPTQEL